ncbi:TPM domain-containing protein [Rubricoccus marinus]|uniref:TPM domain-containing protein n=1 Tax=Rubricoccus marinus TaxID=716817 RepID=A0A259TZI4_9BACT|nr:TPM domain-containing protein [Rubricoccus marinus]OZC03131.1 hypothetical protein BSZ36_09190 [Rubricoccus marinus]
MRTLALVLVLASGLLASGAHSQPGVPPLTGRVVDLGEVLSPATEQALDARLRALEDSTTEQVAVLTVPSLNGENLEQWATEVFRTWGLGQADQDNGVLLLIARDDRKIRIEVGYGLEALLTDARAGQIIRDEMTPRFRAGDFDGGTLGAVEAIIGSLDGTYVPPEASGGSSGQTPIVVWAVLVLCMLAAPVLLSFRKLLDPPPTRYATGVMTAIYLAVFGGSIGEGILGANSWSAGALSALGFLAVYLGLDRALSGSPAWQEKRAHRAKKIAAFRTARKRGQTSVVVDGRSYSVPTVSSSSSSGGGFSGGGGSSGGGGASGGW